VAFVLGAVSYPIDHRVRPLQACRDRVGPGSIGAGGRARRALVARRQRAADIVVDQVVMPSFGTSVMESMAAGKPVVANFSIPDMPAACYKPPPLVVANSVSGIADALRQLTRSARRTEIGNAGRAWMIDFCGREAAVPKFVQQLLEIVSRPMKRAWS
jgi:glycosyltransferase involved in cell wall biosynthesis